MFLSKCNRAIVLLLLLFCGNVIFSQEIEKVDYNRIYRHPFSMSINYQSLSPFNSYGSDYNVYEVYGSFKLPLSIYPSLYPVLKLGIGEYDSRNYLDSGDDWDFRQLMALGGIGYTNKFSKTFEAGGDLLLGGAVSEFNNLESSTNYSLPFFAVEMGGYIGLNPSYNMGIEVRSKVKYQQAVPEDGAEMTDFDGISVGIGVTVAYKFGEDPDSANSVIRSLKLSGTNLNSVYAAMQSYYITNPIDTKTITNIDKTTIENIDVYFYQQELMDTPTKCLTIDSIAPGESVDIPLLALFNKEVFQTEGVTPYSGEIIIDYTRRGRAAQQKLPVTYDLYDKTSIVWDNDEKLASFITPADSALRNYTSFIKQSSKESVIKGYNKEIQEAIQVYSALDVIGCLYQSDPASPFTSMQGNLQAVDSVSLARDTLKRITGDCDDLTVLYCSLLETLGVESGFITVPGHIYAVFNTKIPTKKYKSIHPDRNMTISLDGELWIPVEITMIGSKGFMEAWKRGAAQWNSLNDSVESRGFYKTRVAQETFRPVGLTESDLGLQYGSGDKIDKEFVGSMGELRTVVLNSYRDSAKSDPTKKTYNSLGIKQSVFGEYKNARRSFTQSMNLDPKYIPTLINLGNLESLTKDYNKSVYYYQTALAELKKQGKSDSKLSGVIMLNMSKTLFNSEKYSEAEEFFAKAESIVPERSKTFAYISNSGDSTSRASNQGLDSDFIFMEDEQW